MSLNKEEINKIKSKGIMDLIKEDSYLSKKVTYNEFQSSIKTGIDDSSLEEAYKRYCEFKKKNDIKPKGKGIMDLIKEDSYLSKKVTYDEFYNKNVNADMSDDIELEEAVDTYLETCGIKEKSKVYSRK